MMQQQQMAALDQNHAYLGARANAVDAVQGTIAELGNIFQELGVLISEQGANINIIDEEAEQSLTNVNLGRDQLPNPTPTPTPTPTPNPNPNPNPNPQTP